MSDSSESAKSKKKNTHDIRPLALEIGGNAHPQTGNTKFLKIFVPGTLNGGVANEPGRSISYAKFPDLQPGSSLARHVPDAGTGVDFKTFV